jgi:hypothetical protein
VALNLFPGLHPGAEASPRLVDLGISRAPADTPPTPTIGPVADRDGVDAQAIRFCEREGVLSEPTQ